MFSITNQAEFRKGYEVMGMFKDVPTCKSWIIELKQSLRKYANRPNTHTIAFGWEVEKRIVKDNGVDGFVELVSIPEVFNSEAEAEMFFNDFLYIEAPNSMYDCTGRPFTGWHKIFKRNGRFYAYHDVCFDV